MTADLLNITHEYLKAIRADMKRLLDKQDNFKKLLLQVQLSTASVVHEQSFLTQR